MADNPLLRAFIELLTGWLTGWLDESLWDQSGPETVLRV